MPLEASIHPLPLHWLIGPGRWVGPRRAAQFVRYYAPRYWLAAFPYPDLRVAPMLGRDGRPDMHFLLHRDVAWLTTEGEEQPSDLYYRALLAALEDPLFPFWLPVALAQRERWWLLHKMNQSFVARMLGLRIQTNQAPSQITASIVDRPDAHTYGVVVPAPQVVRCLVNACLQAQSPFSRSPARAGVGSTTNAPPQCSARPPQWRESDAHVPSYRSLSGDEQVRCYFGIPYLLPAYPGYEAGRWDQLGDLDLLTLDVIIALLAHWWAVREQVEEEPVWITAADILQIRGIQAQLVEQERHQHRIRNIAEVATAIKRISHFWVEVDDIPVQRSNKRIVEKGRVRAPLFVLYDFQAPARSQGEIVPTAWAYTPGAWIRPFRDMQRYPQGRVRLPLLHYNRAAQHWAKRLGYYIIFELGGRRQTTPPIFIDNLLAATGLGSPVRWRTKAFQQQALHTALQQLQQDGIIAGWCETPPAVSMDLFSKWLKTKITFRGPEKPPG